MIVWAGVLALTLSLFIAALATPLAGRVATRFGMMDIPQRHKAHARPTPLLGGCAIFAAVLGPSLLAMSLARLWAGAPPEWLPERLAVHVGGAAARAPMALGIFACAVALHVVGLIDDRRSLGPWAKLTAQTAVALVTVLALDVRILTVAGRTVSIVASTLWLVATMNAFNFLDNMDGLSAGVAAICSAALLGASASVGQVFVSAWLCLLLGALLGFLIHNFPPAKIFMGDAGSLVIGYLLGVLSCLTTYVQPGRAVELYGVMAPLVLLAVPLYDTASVIYLRLREGRNPMIGDRRHFSHRLLRRGMTARATVLTIYLCTAATAIAASLLPHVADRVGAVLVLAQTVAIVLLIALLEKGAGQ